MVIPTKESVAANVDLMLEVGSEVGIAEGEEHERRR